MNKLKLQKQEVVIAALVEGNSIRSIERMTGVHRDTIMRLMVRVGNSCERLMDETDSPLCSLQLRASSRNPKSYTGNGSRNNENLWAINALFDYVDQK